MQMFNAAKSVFDALKRGLLFNARNGNITTVEGRKIVKASSQLPYEFLEEVEKVQSAKYRKTLFGKIILASPASFNTEFRISEPNKKDYVVFMTYLEKMARGDDIKIDSVYLIDTLHQKRHDIPYVVHSATSLGITTALRYNLEIEVYSYIKEPNTPNTKLSVSLSKSLDFQAGAFEVNIIDRLSVKGFHSISLKKDETNKKIIITAYYNDIECSFICKCHSFDLNNNTIVSQIIQVFDKIDIESCTKDTSRYFNVLYNELGFYNIKTSTEEPDIHITAHYEGTKYSFTFHCPIFFKAVQNEISLEEKNVDSMTGYEFEEFCHALLLKNGYDSVEITPSSRDQGIDLIAYKDDVKYGIQCKCYSDDVGNKAVQEAIAGKTFYKCHIGVVLTNRYFTRSARELAESSGILLWDRDRMLKMIFHAK